MESDKFEAEHLKLYGGHPKIRSLNLPGEEAVRHISRWEWMKYFDDRGYFLQVLPESSGRKWAQVNFSSSSAGVFRGLHCQLPPYDQEKAVVCLRGRIIDFAVNLDESGKDFGDIHISVLEGQSSDGLLLPGSYLHGFLASEDSQILYLTSKPYEPQSEIVVDARYLVEQAKLGLETYGALIRSDRDSNGISFYTAAREFSRALKKGGD